MVSLYMSPLAALLNVVLACVLGLLFVAVLKSEKIPFGPSISLASFVTLLVGEKLAAWYLGLF
jgi:leader peptidase (prepilin peptidase)/N-methyltransferase